MACREKLLLIALFATGALALLWCLEAPFQCKLLWAIRDDFHGGDH